MAESRIDELRRRVAADPASGLFAQLAEECRKAGEHAEAVRLARAGLAVHPGYASARVTLGRALLAGGDAETARVELTQALRQAPESILAGRCLGEALEAGGDLAAALRQYRATLHLAPGDRELARRVLDVQQRLELGGAGSESRRPPAPGEGRQAPSPDSSDGSGAAGVERREAARVAEAAPSAEAGAEASVTVDSPPLSSSTLAELYLKQGFPDQAIEVYRQVVAENPANERARARLRELEGERAGGKRRMLELTIAGLETLLGTARRR